MRLKKTLVSIIALVLALLMIFSVLIGALTSTVSAARSDELEERLDELKEEKSNNDAQQQQVQDMLDENYDEIRALVEKKLEIDENINKTREQIDLLNERIREFNISIAEKAEELAASEAERAELNEKYKQRLRAMEENGEISYWSILFNANSFSDLLGRVDMIQEIVTADQLMLEQMNAVLAEIAEDHRVLEVEKQALEDTKAELYKAEELLAEQRKESDSYIQQINSDILKLNALMLEYENNGSELEEQIGEVNTAYNQALAEEEAERIRREEAKKAALLAQQASKPSAGSVNTSGFLFPLPAGQGIWVSSPFGYRNHPVDGVYTFHYGVDFAANTGTPVYATKSGTVLVATYGSVNGNYVKLQHEDGSLSYYLHLDTFAVKKGDSVKQGQKLGTVGSTGKSTGPHLHFEIKINDKNVNPMDYVKLQ